MKIPTTRIIDRKELRHIVSFSDVHLRRLEQQGRFPARIKIGANRIGWAEDEVLQWIEQKKQERKLNASKFDVASAVQEDA